MIHFQTIQKQLIPSSYVDRRYVGLGDQHVTVEENDRLWAFVYRYLNLEVGFVRKIEPVFVEVSSRGKGNHRTQLTARKVNAKGVTLAAIVPITAWIKGEEAHLEFYETEEECRKAYHLAVEAAKVVAQESQNDMLRRFNEAMSEMAQAQQRNISKR